MTCSIDDARAILRATGLVDIPDLTQRLDGLVEDLRSASRVYRHRRMMHALPTTKQLREEAAKLDKSARQLQTAVKALSDTTQQNLRHAASEWAARQKEKMAFPGLPHVAAFANLPGSGPYEVIDYRGDEFVDRFLDDLNYFAKVSDWLVQTYEPGSKALGGLPAKGGRQRFDAIEAAPGYDGKPISPQVWLIGKEIPRLYARYVGAVYSPRVPEQGEGPQSPSMRFATACLAALGVKTDDGKDFSFSAIKEYFDRAQPPPPTQQSKK